MHADIVHPRKDVPRSRIYYYMCYKVRTVYSYCKIRKSIRIHIMQFSLKRKLYAGCPRCPPFQTPIHNYQSITNQPAFWDVFTGYGTKLRHKTLMDVER